MSVLRRDLSTFLTIYLSKCPKRFPYANQNQTHFNIAKHVNLLLPGAYELELLINYSSLLTFASFDTNINRYARPNKSLQMPAYPARCVS